MQNIIQVYNYINKYLINYSKGRRVDMEEKNIKK